MEVVFATRKLERYFLEHKEAERKFGEQVARRLIQRVNIIQKARSFDELQRMPGLGCHRLKGPRKGQWAVTLVGRYRLTFRLEGASLSTVRLMEVSNHYGD